MKYIVDTQALIWFVEGNKQLNPKARKIIENISLPIFTSVACIWEMGIKISIGKLQLSRSLPEFVSQIQQDKISILGIESAHIFELMSLPHFHKDPFDRIVIAQAIAEGMKIISSDEAFKQYPVSVIW